jgi:hypothetical protein
MLQTGNNYSEIKDGLISAEQLRHDITELNPMRAYFRYSLVISGVVIKKKVEA